MLEGPHYIAPTGSTGNLNPGSTIHIGTAYENLVLQFVVEAAGSTPTATFKFQSSLDGTNWVDAAYVTDSSDALSQATQTVTAVGATRLYTVRPARWWRVVVTANTNITFRAEAYQSGWGL